jgi:NTE family protein
MAIYVALHYDVAMQNKSGAGLKVPAEKQVLVLQGGGALGAYQAGAYEALAAAGHEPEWITGISIGAINAAIIAGNTRENRVPRLKAFWHKVSSGLQGASAFPGDHGRIWFNETSSMLSTVFGVPGFYRPHLFSPFFAVPGSSNATSFYETTPLRETLSELVDFQILNARATRLSVGAVSLTTGQITYFDNSAEDLRVEHIMASGALPPAFAPVKIGDDHFWDGGIVSNTPLRFVVDDPDHTRNLCVFQVDLFSSHGKLPGTIIEAAEREKEIRYASRSIMNSNAIQEDDALRDSVRKLIAKLPEEMQNDPDVIKLKSEARDNGITVMHLVNRSTNFDTQNKDNEFSRLSVEEHWASGFADAQQALQSPDWLNRDMPEHCMVSFDTGKKMS